MCVFLDYRAPDGTCLLANSNDNCLRLYNLPEELYFDGGENRNIQEMVRILKLYSPLNILLKPSGTM